MIRRISSNSRCGGRVCARRIAAQLVERQVGHDALVAVAVLVEDHETPRHPAHVHRLQIEAAAGDLGGIGILGQDARKRLASPSASLTTCAR